mmetsp:Transcript_17296/g.28921  ORF Transcript_17296/g.28921 Transcript_17296/m.28921 type:complete len:82 (-) Transcript_17296:10-255(-)
MPGTTIRVELLIAYVSEQKRYNNAIDHTTKVVPIIVNNVNRREKGDQVVIFNFIIRIEALITCLSRQCLRASCCGVLCLLR